MHNTRKKHLVDKSVQGAILLRLIAHWALFIVATTAFVYFVELLTSSPRDAGKSMFSRNGPTLLAVLALSPILVRDLCRLTNRFAGPMVRLRRAMRELADGGEVAPIHFRDHDFWQDLAVDFNRVVDRLQTAEQPMKEDDMQVPVTSHAGGGDHV